MKLTDVLSTREFWPTVGVSTNVFDNPAHFDELIDRLSLTFGAIEFEIGGEAQKRLFDGTDAGLLHVASRIRELTEKRQTIFSVHAAWFGKDSDLACEDLDTRRRSVALLKKSVDVAHCMGARLVSFHPGYLRKTPIEKLIYNLTLSVEEVSRYAAQKGIQICAENMGADRPAFIVLSTDQQINLSKQTGCGITLDVVHLASVIRDSSLFENALRDLAPYVKELHIADMAGGSHRHLPIGEGDFDLNKVKVILNRHGFHGAAIIEEFVREFTPEYFVQRADLLRQALFQ